MNNVHTNTPCREIEDDDDEDGGGMTETTVPTATYTSYTIRKYKYDNTTNLILTKHR